MESGWQTSILAQLALLQQEHPEQNCLQDSVQWWRKHTKSSIGQAKVRAFNTMKFKILLGGKPTPLMWSKNTGQVTGKGNQYTISENKEPQNSRYLTIIRRAWQRHERKYINNTSMYSKHTQTINKGIHKEVATRKKCYWSKFYH